MIAIINITNDGINLLNIFAVSYFVFLGLNSCNISDLQLEKNSYDLYFYFIGPMIFMMTLYYFEYYANININIKKNRLKGSIFVFYLFIIYIILKIYIFRITGIRLFSDKWLSMYSDEYTIPVISGIAETLSWLLLMLSLHVKNKKMTYIYIASVLICSGVLIAKRGNIVRFLIFILIYKTYVNNLFWASRKAFISIVAVFISFAWMGNLRQKMRYDLDFNIADLLQSHINNPIFNWVYSYTALNFDVLKVDIENNTPTYTFYSLLYPLIRIYGGNSTIIKIEEIFYSHGLHGFNASTFLSGFIIEKGVFYIFDIWILAVIVGFLANLSRNIHFTGGYVMLLFLTSITFFGNYYFVPIFLYSIIIGIILFIFFDITF